MKNKQFILPLIILLILAACGSQEGQPTNNKGGVSSTPNNPKSDAESDPLEGNPANTPEETEKLPSDDSEAPDDEEEQNPDTEVVETAPEILYYMNPKTYYIKPIDEQADPKVVLLTFDDGPKEKEMNQKMINIMDEHGAKAIFFLNGDKIKQKPELLELIHESNNTIGNHSYAHIPLNKETPEVIDEQIEKTQILIEEIIGERPQFFRPPHAAGNDYIKKKVKEEGMLYMTWSNGSLDWDRDHQTAEAVIKNVMEQLRPGSNILMHELPWTIEALDELLTKISDEGYRFVDPRSIRIFDESTDPNLEE